MNKSTLKIDRTASEQDSSWALSLPELQKRCAEWGNQEYVIAEFVPVQSVNILVGDSGLGKSPFAYQMAVSVASGTPFLAFNARQGSAIYVDLENGDLQIAGIASGLCQHLGLQEPPADLVVLPGFPPNGNIVSELRKTVERFTPILVVIDSLRAFEPNAEKSNTDAATLIKTLRILTKEFDTSFLLVHHIKKPDTGASLSSMSLQTDPAMQWLNCACGARSLINQTDVRLGIEPLNGNENADLIVKGFARTRGEIGPFYLSRKFAANGEPLGYVLASDVVLLNNDKQLAAFSKLADEFTFKHAKQSYGHGDQATTDFLQKCIGLGLLTKVSKGQYRKTPSKETGVIGVSK